MKTLNFSIKVDVDDEKDFEIEKFIEQLKDFTDKHIGVTNWKYFCGIEIEYPTIYKEIYCDVCDGIHTHISERGDDFKCLECESSNLRKLLKDGFL